ncbi:MAG: hypothetical protein methR_P0614 [Methyloprofundus sp.]|nr:MAG: hypothetical protein methR_P0614 [Methyloprofundus sp.]
MLEKKIHAALNKKTIEVYGEKINQVVEIGEDLISRHSNIQMEKLEEDFNHDIPHSLISSIRKFIKLNITPLTICFCNSIPQQRIVDNAFHDEKNNLYFVLTVLPWDTNEAVTQLAEASTNKPYGYTNRLINIFDSWPSENTKYLFHMIICFNAETGNFKMHNCITEYPENRTKDKDIHLLPIELLNDEELAQLNTNYII